MGKESNQVQCNSAQSLNQAQVLFDVGKLLCILHVIKVHDFVFDVEVQLTSQKAAQILVDEVVGCVLGGVAG